MTTPRPAPEGHPGTALPAVADPDRETLTRVLDGLRELPRQSRSRRAGDDADGDAADTGGTPAVPLPRRRRAPSLG